jgi:polyferredoxin
MLRKIRIALATVFFIFITLLFLDFTGTIHTWFGWMAQIQFLPAVMTVNAIVIIFLMTLTLIFGRIYCSVICPLGVLQDIIGRFGKMSKKNRYKYSPAINWLRYPIFVIFLICAFVGIGSIVALLAPYSSYGRIAQNLFSPIWRYGNNLLAYLAERHDSYAFYETDIWIRSIGTLAISAVTLFIICILAWRNGRTYCNTICPVGTFLGHVSRYSLLKPTIDTSRCNGCGLCARNCKAACIDSKTHSIDYSRCVDCMDCIDKCRQKAICYNLSSVGSRNNSRSDNNAEELSVDSSRRTFLTATAALATTAALKAQEKTVDGGLAVILDKKPAHRNTPIVPPGAIGLRHFRQHCTACQLCVAVCPNNVLRPSTELTSYMQPESSYERGYCRPECTKCSEVCPAGAIIKIDTADKSATQIGHAIWVKKNCIPITDGVECGNCARHCPAEAILMVNSDPSDPESLKIPAVNEEKCIGCGACENLCPARPFSAIYVEGHKQHKTI